MVEIDLPEQVALPEEPVEERPLPNRPNWRSWLVWGLATIFVMFQFLLQTSPSVMQVPQMKDFGVSAVKVSVLSSSYFYTYLVLQIPAGLVVDRLGAKLALIFSCFLCTISLLFFSLAPTFLLAMLARMLMGISTAAALVSSFYLAANWFPPRKFAVVVGLTETLAMIGGALGVQGMAPIVIHWGWRHALMGCSVAVFILGILMIFFVKNRPREAVNPVEDQHHISLAAQFIEVIRYPQVWICGIFCGLAFTVITPLAGYWIVPYIMQRFQVNLEVATIGGFLLFLGAAIGSPIIGHLSDHWGKRKPLMAIGTVLTIIALAAAFYMNTTSFVLVLTLLFIAGFFCSVYLLPFAVVSEITGLHVRATAMGFTNMMCILIGAPILQPFIAILLEKNWDGKVISGGHVFSMADYRIAFSTFLVCLVIGLISLLFLREKYCLTKDEGQDS